MSVQPFVVAGRVNEWAVMEYLPACGMVAASHRETYKEHGTRWFWLVSKAINRREENEAAHLIARTLGDGLLEDFRKHNEMTSDALKILDRVTGDDPGLRAIIDEEAGQ